MKGPLWVIFGLFSKSGISKPGMMNKSCKETRLQILDWLRYGNTRTELGLHEKSYRHILDCFNFGILLSDINDLPFVGKADISTF